MMPNCDYMAVDWSGYNWVRFEHCRLIEGYVRIGARDFRRIISTDRGRCRDSDKKAYVRYKIGEVEWVCILE